MDLRTLAWSDDIIRALGLEGVVLPEIVSSAERMGEVDCAECADCADCADAQGCRKLESIRGAAITGCVGDQQASMLGHQLQPKHVKSTYGTGCFVLMNTGTNVVESDHGLLSTVAFKLGRDAEAMYALEGAIGTAGQGISWLRDALEMINSSEESEMVAASADDCQGVLFVPAHSGLLAPFWCPDARAAILGMTYATERKHIVRAMLAAICFQTKAVLDAMASDCGSNMDQFDHIDRIVVDGGASANSVLMQMQADVLGKRIVRAASSETTALGAAVAAGVGAGLWEKDALQVVERGVDRAGQDEHAEFVPKRDEGAIKRHYEAWMEAVRTVMGLRIPAESAV